MVIRTKVYNKAYFLKTNWYITKEMKESAKDTASRGMESAKEMGSKAADRGHGNYDDSIFLRVFALWCGDFRFL